jgi:hypothetical protein
MPRIIVMPTSFDKWNTIIGEANRWFGRGGWRAQRGIRQQFTAWPVRRFKSYRDIKIWMEIPDTGFASWISLKYNIKIEEFNPEIAKQKSVS